MIRRIVGASLIVSCCGGVGFLRASQWRREEMSLEQLRAGVDYMICQLRYQQTPLPRLCAMAGNHCGGLPGTYLIHLQKLLENRSYGSVEGCSDIVLQGMELPSQIRELLARLGRQLGSFDLEGQVRGLEQIREECVLRLEQMREGRTQRLRSYQTLGLCAGAALAILLV